MSYIDNLKYSDIAKARLTNIEYNYKRLMENYSPINALKFCEYLRKKDKYDLVNNFECVYTVPSKSAWLIIEALIDELFIDKDYSSINKIQESIADYKQLCLDNNQVSTMEYIDESLKKIKESFEKITTEENTVSRVMKMYQPSNNEVIDNAVKTLVESEVYILLNEDSEEFADRLSKIEDSEKKLEKNRSEQ